MVFIKQVSISSFVRSNQIEEVKRMNRMMTSAIAFGAGIAAYNMMQRNNMISERRVKRMARKVRRAIF